MRYPTIAACGSVSVWILLAILLGEGEGRASSEDVGDVNSPAQSRASAAVSSSAGTLLPLTMSPRVNVEQGAVAVTSGYDGGNGSATLVTTADLHLVGPVAVRAGFTYLPDATGRVFQPHVGLRAQVFRQGRHGFDGAVGLFYRMERFTEDEGMIQLFWAAARRFDDLSVFANLAYGQDPEGDDRDGELRIAVQYAAAARLQVGFDGRMRVDLFSTDSRRAMRGTTDLDFAMGPLATLTVGRLAVVGQAGMSGVRAAVMRTGVLATVGVASVF